jgi:hypothetical protein
LLAFGLQRVDHNPLYELSGMSQADYESFNQDIQRSLPRSEWRTHVSPHRRALAVTAMMLMLT